MVDLSKENLQRLKYFTKILNEDYDEWLNVFRKLPSPNSHINSWCLTAYLYQIYSEEGLNKSFDDFKNMIGEVQTFLSTHLICHENYNEEELEEGINDDIESFQDIDEAFDEASYRRMVEIAKPIVKLAFDDQENEILINAFRIKE